MDSNTLREAMMVLRSDSTSGREHFANMVARGLIDTEGNPTTLVGGEARPATGSARPNVYTVEDGDRFSTNIRIGAQRGRTFVQVLPLGPESPERLGELLAHEIQTKSAGDRVLQIYDNHEGGRLVAAIRPTPSGNAGPAWQPEVIGRRGAPMSTRALLAEAIDDVFRALEIIAQP